MQGFSTKVPSMKGYNARHETKEQGESKMRGVPLHWQSLQCSNRLTLEMQPPVLPRAVETRLHGPHLVALWSAGAGAHAESARQHFPQNGQIKGFYKHHMAAAALRAASSWMIRRVANK